jgi:mono/diheme cytochrome c family protein
MTALHENSSGMTPCRLRPALPLFQGESGWLIRLGLLSPWHRGRAGLSRQGVANTPCRNRFFAPNPMTQAMKRAFIACTLLLTLAGVPLRAQQPSAAQHRALVNQYCITCHNEKLKTGDLMLDKLDLEHVGAQAETWEKVARKVRAGLMPPAGAPRPQRAALAAFASAVEQDLDRAAATTSNPGRAPLHRMNRAEYGNAIRDLLGVEIDPVTMLPADDSSNGFDNIADVLGVSPALLERYVSAAAKISRVAVGDPEISPLDVTYTVKGDLSQTSTVDGLPMGTRGGTAIRHNFPLDGEYLIKLSLQKLSFGQVFGSSAEGEMLEVTLNGERVKLYQLDDMPYFFMRDKPGQPVPLGQLKDPKAERLRMSPNINMEFRLKVKAGPQDIRVAFLNTSYVANEDLVHRPGASTYDSNNGMQYGYYTVPHLGKVDITGPYNATGSGDTPSRRKIFVCRPASSTAAAENACAQKIISNLVRHAFRRPANDNDVELFESFYQQGRSKGSFDAGIEMALRRILADPEFVFRFETSPANVKPGEAYRLGDLELASRLSFFLWSSIPDDQLLNTAIQGKLHEPAVLDRETRRMLKDPKADALVKNFAGQWLFLRDLKSTNPDSREFPDFDDNLRQSFVRETEMLFESVLREDRSVLDLLDADYTFVNERLAKHYGIPGIYGPDFRRVTVPSDARRGLLGQGSMLLVTSNANRTSPVQRGKWILENILGSPPPLPPPNVPPLKESVVGAKQTSVRERMEEHRSNPVCAACHKIMDPIGLALENFDGTGQWRTVDSGFSIDPSSQLVDGTPLDGPSSLRKALLSRPEAVVGTMTQKLLMYGIGRETKYNDMPVVRAIMRGAEPNRYKFSDLVLGVVRSAPFQMRVKENAPSSVADARRPEQ